MKKWWILLSVWGAGTLTYACEVCEKQQPRILRGVTHGTGPQSNFDYVAIWIMVVITLATLYYSIKWLIRPGEKSTTHIKRFILKDEYYGA